MYIIGYLRGSGGRKIFPLKRASGKDYGNEYTTTVIGEKENTVKIKNCTKKGYQEAKPGDGINLAYPESKTRRGRVGDQISNTLTANGNMGTLEWSGEKYRIRKLTPKECWRLQGFSDEAFEKAKATGMSDSQLYKQAGNAVTVNVIYAIGKLLKEVEE